MTAGIFLIFAGYTVASYGVVLLKGWDIPWRQWVNPLDAWQWPGSASDIPKTPATQILPS